VTSDKFELMINPVLLNAKSPDPIYVHFVLEVPGHRLVYQMENGSDFEVPNNPSIIEKRWFQGLIAGLLFLILLVVTLIKKPRYS